MPKRPLTLIESPAPTAAQKVLSGQKRAPRPAGMLQCPACGGRSVMTVRNGVVIQEGRRKHAGTVIAKNECAQCWKQGKRIRMVPGGQGPKLVR